MLTPLSDWKNYTCWFCLASG